MEYFTRRASGHSDADGVVGRSILEKVGNDLRFQVRERFRIAEEASYRDQNILEQRSRLIWTINQILRVVLNEVRPDQLHPSGQAAQNRRALVSTENVTRSAAELDKNRLEGILTMALNGSNGWLIMLQGGQPS